MATEPGLQVDGRIQRSERSREAIVQALIDLVGRGKLAPTAQQVAERANVGVRTVFRHFSDMDTLFVAMNKRLTDQVSALFVNEKQTGPIRERIAAFVARRAQLFEVIAPFYRADQLQRWRSTFLQEEHLATVKLMRADLYNWLPELASAETSSHLANSLELVLCFESWDHLRTDQNLTARAAENVLHHTLTTMLGELLD